MSIEKIVQYLNRKPTEEELQELSDFGVIDSKQAQELRGHSVERQGFDLRDNQKLALVQLIKEKVVFVDDDTGSGKTAIAVKGIQYLEETLGEPVKSLFFSPNTIKPQWKRRIQGYLPNGYIDADDILIIGEENGNGYDAIRGARVVIINYERLARDSSLAELIQKAGFTFVNFDEFQRAKNHGGKTSRNLKIATTGIPYRMATTASPYRRSLKDPANLLALLDPKFFEQEQRREVENNKAYAQDSERLPPDVRDDLSKFILDKYVRGESVPDVGPLRAQYGRVKRKGIRKTTEEMTGRKISIDYSAGAYDLLPEEARVYEVFRNADLLFPEVPLKGAEKLELLRHVLRDVSVLTPEYIQRRIKAKKQAKEKGGKKYSSVYTKLQQIFETHPEMRLLGEVQSSRYQALRNVLAQIPSGEEVVVFTDKKTGVVDRIEDILNEHYGTNSAVKITGDVTTDLPQGRYFTDREIAMLRFQVSDGVRAAVATQQTSGEGIRLDRASNLVLFELPYTWDDIKQMIGRLEGPNQTRDINVYVVNERTRLDQGIIELINHRRKVGNRFLKGTEDLTEQEIRENLDDKPTHKQGAISQYIQSDLVRLLQLIGRMRDNGFQSNYTLLQQTEIDGEKASKFFARVYESFLENSLPGNMSRLITQIVKGLGGEGRIADMGAGTAFLGRNIRQIGLELYVANLDINHDALSYGRQIAEERGVKQAYVDSDMGASAFRSNSFDFVVASMSLDMQSLEERVNSIRELFRIAKPGAYVIITEKGDYLTEEQKQRYLAGLENLGGKVAEISGFYRGKEANFDAFIAVAQKVAEPNENVNPEDFLYTNTQKTGLRKSMGQWTIMGQRCENFVHEDGTTLEKKVEKYRDIQRASNIMRILGYDIIILDEANAKKYHLQKTGRKLGKDFIFVEADEKRVYVYQPNIDNNDLQLIVRKRLSGKL